MQTKLKNLYLILLIFSLFPVSAFCQPDNTKSLHRMRNDRIQNHFYTADASEKATFKKNGYKYEGVIGKVYTTQVPGSVPLVRLYNASEKNHFYTAHPKSVWEPLTTRSYSRYVYEGVVGYVFKNAKPGHIPLYRLRSDSQKNHFYTTHEGEYNKVRKRRDYKDEGVECYILPASAKSVATTVKTPTSGTGQMTGGLFTTKVYTFSGNPASLNQINFSAPKSTYNSKMINIPQDKKSALPTVLKQSNRTENVAIVWEGKMTVAAKKTYEFELISDDGSRLYIDNRLFIDNDGVHGANGIRKKITLTPGTHQIKVQYFQGLMNFIVQLKIRDSDSSAFEVFDISKTW